MPVTQENDEYRYTRHNGHTEASRVVVAYPPSHLLTEGLGVESRLQVDNGSTGFFLGKEFRFFYEFSVPQGDSAWVRVQVAVNSTLKFQTIAVSSGDVRFRAWRDATDNGPWSNPASPSSGFLNMNSAAAEAFEYVGQNSVQIGGDGAADPDGVVSEVVMITTADNSNFRNSVGGASGQFERGVRAGTYHLQIENTGTGTTTGVYEFVLEERG